jgi:hypothetical protein
MLKAERFKTLHTLFLAEKQPYVPPSTNPRMLSLNETGIVETLPACESALRLPRFTRLNWSKK